MYPKPRTLLKCGFCKNWFIVNAPLRSSQLSISLITFGWVCCCTHPKVIYLNLKFEPFMIIFATIIQGQKLIKGGNYQLLGGFDCENYWRKYCICKKIAFFVFFFIFIQTKIKLSSRNPIKTETRDSFGKKELMINRNTLP